MTVESIESDPVQHWQRIKAILGKALELPVSEQMAFISQHAAGERELQELSALVDADRSQDTLLERLSERIHCDALQDELGDAVVGRVAGRVVGNYRLVSLIAAGGMGQVYRAEPIDPGTHGAVAIKFMREGATDPSLQQRFLAESKTLAALDHPNLAKFVDSASVDGIPYIVMELVEGEPIDIYCRRVGASTEQKIRLFQTLCDVVHHAHCRNVIHRDLKPANVLVTHDGVVKLVDFGIAKQLDRDTRTRTALRVMTLDCASPEQIRGQSLTAASDVYSLGVLLYRLLTGQAPYAIGNDADEHLLRRAICEVDPPKPSRAGNVGGSRELSGNLDAVLRKALQKLPTRRYPSARALAEDLTRHLQGLTVDARKTWVHRLGHEIVGRPMQSGVMVAAGLTSLACLTFALHAWSESKRQQALAVQRLMHLQTSMQMAVDSQNSLRQFPSAFAPQEQALHDYLKHLEPLKTLASDDAAFNTQLGLSYLGLAQALAGPDRMHLNDRAGAEKALADSIDVLTRVVEMSHDDRTGQKARAGLVGAQDALARLYGRDGRTLQAQALARQALSQAQGLAHATPREPTLRIALALANLALAQVLPADGSDAQTDGAIRTAIELLKEVPADAADDTVTESLAAAYVLRAQYLSQADVSQADSTALAAAEFGRAVQLLQRSGALPSDSPSVELAVANARMQQALALYKSGEADESLALAARARNGVRSLWEHAPHHPLLRERYAEISLSLGQLFLTAGSVDEAVSAISQANDLYVSIEKGAPAERRIVLAHLQADYYLAKALMARSAALFEPGLGDDVPQDWRLACQSIRNVLASGSKIRSRWAGDSLLPDEPQILEMRQVMLTCPGN